MRYDIKIIAPGLKPIRKKNLTYEQLNEAIGKCAGKKIDIIIESSTGVNDCPCKFHLGCLTPNLCNEKR